MRRELTTGRRRCLCRIAMDGGSKPNFVRAPSGLGVGRLFRPGSGSHLNAMHVHDHVLCKTRWTTSPWLGPFNSAPPATVAETSRIGANARWKIDRRAPGPE